MKFAKRAKMGGFLPLRYDVYWAASFGPVGLGGNVVWGKSANCPEAQ